MRQFNNDTLAHLGATVSGSAAVIQFAVTWQPVFALCLALVGIVSGLFAIAYYIKRLRK